MKWSWKLGRFAGIEVNIHLTFLLLVGFIGLNALFSTGTLAGMVMSIVYLLALFGSVLLHEYGHALAARRYGIPTQDITLYPIGGIARLERVPEKPAHEFVVALAGPAVNVIIAAVLFAGLWLTGGLTSLSQVSLLQGSLLERLMYTNISLAVFNLLPAFPMDGGRVLRALLALRLDYVRATQIAATLGKGMAILFGVLGLFGNPMLILIAVFVWMAASQEARQVELTHAYGAPFERAPFERMPFVWLSGGWERRPFDQGRWVIVQAPVDDGRAPRLIRRRVVRWYW